MVCHCASSVIDHNENRIGPFLFIVMPNALRLNEENEALFAVSRGLLESVEKTTAIEVQERVVDAVGFLYMTFKLQGFREELTRAAGNFALQLETVVRATSSRLVISGLLVSDVIMSRKPCIYSQFRSYVKQLGPANGEWDHFGQSAYPTLLDQ
jgi:hypothetical protein